MKTNKKTRVVKVEDFQFQDSEDFRRHIVAQDDDCDYSESGWVAVVKGRIAGLAKYSHCSCFGTWTALHGNAGNGSLVWDWCGLVNDLVKMAKRNADPHIPERTASENDYDYDHLQKVYVGVVEWDAAGRKES